MGPPLDDASPRGGSVTLPGAVRIRRPTGGNARPPVRDPIGFRSLAWPGDRHRLARQPYSASRIEQYVECGFKFYADNVLEIEDPDDVEVVPTALETGSYVHDVLERFYADLQDDPEANVDLSKYDRDTLADHLRAIAVEELREVDFEYDGLFYERWKAELFAGLGDEDAVPFEAGVQSHNAPEQGLFATFLENELFRTGFPYLFEPPSATGFRRKMPSRFRSNGQMDRRLRFGAISIVLT